MFTISKNPISNEKLLSQLTDSASGARVIFEGLVRNHNEGRSVNALEYESSIALSKNEAQKIFAEAFEKFNINQAIGQHRIGFLNIGDIAVWIGVTASHRHDAYKASRYIIDEIKARLPIWKKEHYVDGRSDWVDCKNCSNHQHSTHYTEKEFYSRQTCLPSIGNEGQEKLKNASALIVGCGGLGSHAATQLAAAGVGTIGLCDYDTLQIHNLHRQTLYSIKDLDRPKVDLAKERLIQLNPFVHIHTHNTKFTIESASKLIQNYDILIDGTDDLTTKYLLNDLAVANQKPLIQASIYQYDGQINFYQPNKSDASCLRCSAPTIPPEGCVGICQEAGVLGSIAASFGTLQANEAIKYFLGLPILEPNVTLIWDLTTYHMQKLKQCRNPNCPTCGNNAHINGTNPSDYENIVAWELNAAHIDFSSFKIIDIRSHEEIKELPNPLKEITHIPLEEIENKLMLDPNSNYLFICRKGLRSQKLVQLLRDQENTNAFSLQGGVEKLLSSLPQHSTYTVT